MEWWLLRDDHHDRAAVVFGGVWVEARVLLRDYEYGKDHVGTAPRESRGTLFVFFFLAVFSMEGVHHQSIISCLRSDLLSLRMDR